MPAPSFFQNPYGQQAYGGGGGGGRAPRMFQGTPAAAAPAAAPRRNPYGGLIYKKGYSDIAHQGYRELGERYERGRGLYDLYGENLADPTKAGKQFQGFFETAAQGISAPALRDFNKELSSVQAGTAARFGGGASSEESRQAYNTSDLFSRNLTEALARLAPQAAGLGLQYTGELGTAARGAVGEQDQLMALILQALNKPKKPNTLAQVIGTGAGAALGSLVGQPGAGAAAGQGVARAATS